MIQTPMCDGRKLFTIEMLSQDARFFHSTYPTEPVRVSITVAPETKFGAHEWKLKTTK